MVRWTCLCFVWVLIQTETIRGVCMVTVTSAVLHGTASVFVRCFVVEIQTRTTDRQEE